MPKIERGYLKIHEDIITETETIKVLKFHKEKQNKIKYPKPKQCT